MREPTMTRALPVAQDGMEAKIGEKNIEMKNMNPVVIAVRPVLPPSLIFMSWGIGKARAGEAYHWYQLHSQRRLWQD